MLQDVSSWNIDAGIFLPGEVSLSHRWFKLIQGSGQPVRTLSNIECMMLLSKMRFVWAARAVRR